MEEIKENKTLKDNKEVDENVEDNNTMDDEQPPMKKKLKFENKNIIKKDEIVNVKIRNYLLNVNLKKNLENHWLNETCYGDDDNQVKFYVDPFKHCILQNFIENPVVINRIIDEMTTKIHWTRKQMDLYEFYQSTDLSNISLKYLKEFFTTLQTTVMPWMENITGIKLNKVSASCSMYNCGDYLLLHDDLLNDRQIAFIYYLSPWKNIELWKPDMGGCLEIFNTDANFLPQLPSIKKISPCNNQFVFFKVGKKSYHQVSEVTTFDYPRLTINGWFHGKENDDEAVLNPSLISQLIFEKPIMYENIQLENFISNIYLDNEIKSAIQKHIEDNSEISLQDFFKEQKYNEILNELKLLCENKWKIKGPANIQHYEILINNDENETIKEFIKLFKSEKMFKLLYEYTDLDLFGNNAKNPTCNIEIQRWHHGYYTILGDDLSSSCDKNTLECIFYLNATDDVGVITYVSSADTNSNLGNDNDNDTDGSDSSDESNSDDNTDDSVLLTITPKNNNLSIIYRSKGTSKFTKYVSKKCKIPHGHVYTVVASYRE